MVNAGLKVIKLRLDLLLFLLKSNFVIWKVVKKGREANIVVFVGKLDYILHTAHQNKLGKYF